MHIPRDIVRGEIGMTGRELKNYRRGDWNEELGILLLKALAAVFPVLYRLYNHCYFLEVKCQ